MVTFSDGSFFVSRHELHAVSRLNANTINATLVLSCVVADRMGVDKGTAHTDGLTVRGE